MPIRKSTYKYTSKKPYKKRPSLKFYLGLIALTLLLVALPVAYFLVSQNQDLRQQAYTSSGGTGGDNGSGGSTGGGGSSGGGSTGGGGSSGGGGGGSTSCAEEDVNTQFRMYEEGTDKPWTDGNKMTVKVGDKIDVNCFAKTGSALLSNGKITLKVDGVATTIPTSSVINDGRSLKAYEITQGGVLAFTCANSANCSDTDQVSAPKTTTTCSADTDCKDGEFCYQPPMPECPDGMGCAAVMPAKICKARPTECTNPSAADINKDCVVDLKDYDLFLSEFIKSL